MDKKIIFSYIFLAILVAMLVAGFVLFYFLKPETNNKIIENEIIPVEQETDEEIIQKFEKLYNQQFPDVLTGTMKIVSETKAFIKTEDGKEYLISPFRPIAYYKDCNVVNGTKVELRGKIIDSKTISLGVVKSLASNPQ